jgi:integrase
MTVLLDVIKGSTRLRPATVKTYATAVENFLAFAGGSPLTGALVEAWRDHRLGSGASAATVHKGLAALKFASRRAAALGLLPADFAAAAEFPARAPWSPRKALTVEEFLALERVCRDDPTPAGLRDLTIIDVAGRACGARRGALAALTVGSYKKPHLKVPKKGGGTQIVTVDAVTGAALEAWLAWRRGRGSDSLFVSLHRTVEDMWGAGKGLSASGIAYVITARAKQAGLRRHVHPHLLRHTHISLALAAGAPPHRVMSSAGHRSLATTSRYITDLEADESPVGDTIAAHLQRRK